MTDAELRRTVQELVDRQAIRDCITRYARGVDRHDDDLILSAYHEDAIDHHGPLVGSRGEFAEYVEDFHSSLTTAHLHYVMNETVEIDGDIAHAETYYVAAMRMKGSGDTNMGGGRYVDRLERRDGAWRIVRRACLVEWVGKLTPNPGSDATLPRYISGTWDQSDISYLRPLELPGVMAEPSSRES